MSLHSITEYFIEYEDKYIIYLPYKPMAFIGNRAMVQFIKNKNSDNKNKDDQTVQLLKSIGFFNTDRRVLQTDNDKTEFKPTIGVILLTTACNLNCLYCYASAGTSNTQVIPIETGKWLIDEVAKNAKELRKESFSISIHGGGEPTTAKKQLREFINYAHQKEIKCTISLTTNGFFSEREADTILEGISEITLSFDGIKNVQNRQRPTLNGEESFSRVYDTLKMIEKRNLHYGIRMSVMDDSIAYLPENIEFLCKNTDCKIFQVEPVFRSGRARINENSLKEKKEFIKAFLNALEIAYEHKRNMYYSGVRPWLVTDNFCLAPKEALIVNHNSELTTCYEVYDRKHELGNLFFYGSLKNNLPKIDYTIRDNLSKEIKSRQKKCVEKECFCFPFCAGDCPPKAFLSEENPETGFSERCELNRELTKEVLLFYIEKSGGIWRGEKIVR